MPFFNVDVPGFNLPQPQQLPSDVRNPMGTLANTLRTISEAQMKRRQDESRLRMEEMNQKIAEQKFLEAQAEIERDNQMRQTLSQPFSPDVAANPMGATPAAPVQPGIAGMVEQQAQRLLKLGRVEEADKLLKTLDALRTNPQTYEQKMGLQTDLYDRKEGLEGVKQGNKIDLTLLVDTLRADGKLDERTHQLVRDAINNEYRRGQIELGAGLNAPIRDVNLPGGGVGPAKMLPGGEARPYTLPEGITETPDGPVGTPEPDPNAPPPTSDFTGLPKTLPAQGLKQPADNFVTSPKKRGNLKDSDIRAGEAWLSSQDYKKYSDAQDVFAKFDGAYQAAYGNPASDSENAVAQMTMLWQYIQQLDRTAVRDSERNLFTQADGLYERAKTMLSQIQDPNQVRIASRKMFDEMYGLMNTLSDSAETLADERRNYYAQTLKGNIPAQPRMRRQSGVSGGTGISGGAATGLPAGARPAQLDEKTPPGHVKIQTKDGKVYIAPKGQ